jgi:flagellar motor component MotA
MKNNYYNIIFDEEKEGFKSLEDAKNYIESVFKKFPLGYCLDGDICQSIESLIDENWREVWNYDGINIHVWLENRKNAA